jgi:polysaccharide export outer membrane protein
MPRQAYAVLLASAVGGMPLGVTRAAAQSAVVQSATAPASRGANTTLEVGDLVRVTVWRRPELTGDFRVGGDGALRHPLYQQVKVAGMTIPQTQAQLQTYLRTLEASPQVVVEPLFRVSVGGEIRQPNLYSLPPETSIAQVVALAGGPTERGRLDRVRLVRDGRATVIDLTSTSSAVAAMPIESGDQIFVARRGSAFHDAVVPAVGIVGALAAVANLLRR